MSSGISLATPALSPLVAPWSAFRGGSPLGVCGSATASPALHVEGASRLAAGRIIAGCPDANAGREGQVPRWFGSKTAAEALRLDRAPPPAAPLIGEREGGALAELVAGCFPSAGAGRAETDATVVAVALCGGVFAGLPAGCFLSVALSGAVAATFGASVAKCEGGQPLP